MLAELRVRDLGVIADLDVVLGTGLTALTGETGAGKTLVVEALALLLGGRSEASIVRGGADEAVVEGRFIDDRTGEELVLARTIPRSGRSRSFANGRMATLAELAELGRDAVDLYGQHDHQSLLRPATQRQALDAFAGIDLAPLRTLRGQIAELGSRIDALGGDDRTRAREVDLLRYELGEIDELAITSANEEDELGAEEALLANAVALRAAAASAYERLAGDRSAGAIELLSAAVAELERHPPLVANAERLRSLVAELDDATSDLHRLEERIEEDPTRLAEVLARRAKLHALVRKHGDDLGDVLVFAENSRARLAELEAADEIRSALEDERRVLRDELAREESLIGDARREAAPRLAESVATHFAALALGRARLEVSVPDAGLGDAVEFLLAANTGEPFVPLAKAASGGELARTMLALRLVLSAAPATLVFDEVDAGIGGEAALAVGRALAALALDHQVLVVTHLAQVAAHADHHLAVEKNELDGRTVTVVGAVEGEARLGELSRMLSGHPESEAARVHAAELLAGAHAR